MHWKVELFVVHLIYWSTQIANLFKINIVKRTFAHFLSLTHTVISWEGMNLALNNSRRFATPLHFPARSVRFSVVGISLVVVSTSV